jgi:succinate dehydrogenase/fumarate reductase-like Fe-S protein
LKPSVLAPSSTGSGGGLSDCGGTCRDLVTDRLNCGMCGKACPMVANASPTCGMGVCGECRVTIDGRPHRLGCQVICAPGMEIHRDA